MNSRAPASGNQIAEQIAEQIGDEKPEVNLTSMLDVVFIMLIFFVVTASFVRENGIALNLPPQAEIPPDEVPSLVVRVEPASIFRVENRVLSRASLVPYLTALHAQNPDASFAIVVVEGSLVGDMVAAADAGRRLGFDVIPVSKEQ
ncbi:MAG: biopolymer transporter ExbD [Gammaproteobacteria bacterium]|nr:biopolymer transporter ExbD [Gammaproteobacteria bacterium]